MSNKALLIIAIALALLCACALAVGTGALFWIQRQTVDVSGAVDTVDSQLTGTPQIDTELDEDSSDAASPGDIKDTDAIPGVATPGLAAGGTLRLAGDLPPTLDPAMVQDNTSALYVVHLFSGLVRLNQDLEIVPDLATGWDMEDQGRTSVFHLNPEATFADGTPITAEDVVRSWERACSPELASPVASNYLGDIVGVEAFAMGQATDIEGLDVRDPHTLAVTIDAPKAYFLAKLTYPAALLVDVADIGRQGERWMLNPNGSGPFVLDTLTQDLIVLERNPQYYGEGPLVDRVEFVVNSGLPITMYENDQLDIVSVWADELDRVMDPYNPLSEQLHVAPELSTEYLAMDVTRPPFDDVAVRQAVLKAIDREKLARLVLNNSAVPGRGILPPGLVTTDPDPASEVMAYDPVEARRLLEGSRYAAPGVMPAIVLSISGTSGYMAPIIEAVVAMLEENLGLVVTVEQVDCPTFCRI